MSHHRVSLTHVHPMRLRPWFLFSLFGLCVILQADPTCARPATADEVESQLAAERQRALTQGVATATDAERIKSTTATRTADLEAELTTDKADLAGLQKELLAVLATDNLAAIQVIRTRLATRQAAFDAAEGEKALAQKEAEEAESEREVWKKRAATLELALRMDMKVMLASPADVESCEKRVDAANKEIASQVGQIQKYVSRRDKAALELGDLSKRLRLLNEGAGTSLSADLLHALDDEVRQLQRQIVLQHGWFVLNHKLEQRARRNLAFARTDYLVSRRYADALARKAARWRADEAQVGAEQADAQLAAMRTALAPVQRRASTELAEAARQTEAALKTLGEARTAQEQELAHSTYGSAQIRKNRWEAESDCWKEFLSLQKAGAAFAHELADRARGMAEDRNILEINREEQMLREGLGTSAEFVRSLQTMVQTTGDLIESARRELGLTPEEVASLATPLEDLFGDLDASHPPATDLVFDKIQEIIGRLPGESSGMRMTVDQRHEVGSRLIVRLAQREMLRVRETISERWLHNSQASIQALERVAGTTLWRQNDPRLNDITCQELGTMIGTMASDMGFAWDCWRLRVGGVPGVPHARSLLHALAFVLVLWLLAKIAGRWIPARPPLFWFVGRMVAMAPPLLGGAVLSLHLGRTGNMAFTGLGWLLFGLAAWLTIRYLMESFSRDHRRPAAATLGGGLFVAIHYISGWTAILFPFYRVAGMGENPWDIQAVISRLWLFGVCLALFRLALHPSLMGRLLSRRSEHPALRWLGATVAAICIIAAALAALPVLAGLDNLGRTVLHIVEASFALLIAALLGTAIAGWLMRRHAARIRMGGAWIRLVQATVFIMAGAGIMGIWWRLLTRVVLAPNAPAPVHDLVHAAARAVHTAVHIWHSELTSGMTVSSLVRGLLVFVLSFWVSRILKRLFLERALSRTPMDEATRQTFAAILGYAVILLGFLVGLNVAGSSLQNLTLLAGAITVGLGFGLQNVINNFVSSLLIHFGRTIRVGDYIDVGGTRGVVREIGLRSTSLVTDDEITVLVPNGTFIGSNIVNWTNPSRRIRLHVPFTVTRQADLAIVTEMVTTIARNHPLILKDPAPLVEVRSVTAVLVNLELLAWTEKPEKLSTTIGELNLAMDRPLREKGLVV